MTSLSKERSCMTLCIASLIAIILLYMTSMSSHNRESELPLRICNTNLSKHGREEKAGRGYLIAILKDGGLGNHMFMYAALYGLAKKSHRMPLACSNLKMSVLFPNLSIPIYPINHCMEDVKSETGKLPNRTPTITQKYSPHYFDPHLLQEIKLSNDSHINLHGFLQNTGFFVEYLDELKRDFSLSHTQRDKAYNYLNEQIGLYKNQKSIQGDLQIVGVHVRRGDMAKVPGVNVPTEAYFKKAMDYFRTKFKNKVVFVVSTDDLKWCHQFIKGKDVIFTADTAKRSRDEDFSIQVCCNHTIISFGTFGWWMAFLTKGEVVVFKDWAGKERAKWYQPGQRFLYGWKLM